MDLNELNTLFHNGHISAILYITSHPKYVDLSLVKLDEWIALPLIDTNKIYPTFEKDLAVWLTSNCKRFTLLDHQYYVECEEDAAYFKLVWL